MKNHASYSLSLSLSVALALGSIFLLGAPPAAQAALYLPGETLDPACAPTDSNCGISTIVASSTANSIPYYAANGSSLSATSTFQILASGIASTTNLIVGSSFTLGSLSGFLKAVAGAVATSLINLASDVTGILPIGNGGTGWGAIQTGAIPYGNGSSALSTTTQGIGGYVLAWNNGIPTWVATSSINNGVTSVTGTYPISSSGGATPALSLVFGTTTSNTWAGTQTFTNAPVLGSLSGIVGVNAGTSYSVSTSTLNIGGTALNITGLTAVGNGGTGVAAIASGFIPFGQGASAVATSSALYWDSATSRLGLGTTSPWRNFSLTGTVSSPQFALAYDATRYAQLQTDASGDLSVFSSGGNTRLPDNNLFVCAGGACPTLSLTGTGNLTVENKLTAGSLEQFCPTGYVWVPGSAKSGTLPGFCTMKYEAKNSGGVPVSVPAGGPWVSIDQPTARTACEALGTGYHLISEPERMTLAEQIATLPINDLDADASLQLATGHSDNAPANALDAGTSATDPVVSGCDLMQNAEASANAYAASSCELRGTGSGGSTDADKGYYGTGQQWSATGYSAGGANKAQLRTHVLANGNVIWDIAGNVWEWTDAYLWSASLVGAASSTVSEMPDAGSWTTANWYQYTAITNYKALAYARPKVSTWSSTNGIGQIYMPTDSGTARAFVRGGGWSSGSGAGAFALRLNYAPSLTDSDIGFRCSR
jgi:hypothetical protein